MQQDSVGKNFIDMEFQELCSVNSQGGDPILYNALRSLMTSTSPLGCTDEFINCFDSNLLNSLTGNCSSDETDSEGGGSSGPPGK